MREEMEEQHEAVFILHIYLRKRASPADTQYQRRGKTIKETDGQVVLGLRLDK